MCSFYRKGVCARSRQNRCTFCDARECKPITHFYLRYFVVYGLGVLTEKGAQCFFQTTFAFYRWRAWWDDDYVRGDERDNPRNIALFHSAEPAFEYCPDRRIIASAIDLVSAHSTAPHENSRRLSYEASQ